MTSVLVLERPTSYSMEVVNQDGLWKKVIGDLFGEFLLFFAPDLHEEVDFSKDPDFLQQELFKEIIDKKKGTNHADQIVKVHLKDGKEKWILVHIEVEGSGDTEFPKRMFRYFYRIYDKYEREIVAFAVMTGPSKSEHSLGFTYSYFGTTLDYTYNVHKVSDYDAADLAQSNRLFSKVILAAKYMHQTENVADQRYRFKQKLMREVLNLKAHRRESITAVFYFIDYLLRLPEELTRQLTETMLPVLREERGKMVQHDSSDLSPTLAEFMAIERQEVMEQAQNNFALTLLQEDFEVDYIAKLTKLSVMEIEKLKESLE